MKNNRLLRKLHHESALVSHVMVAIVAGIGVFLDSESTDAARLALLMIIVLVGALGFARYSNSLNINEHPKLHIGLYYLLISSGILFFAPVGSAFSYTWFIVLFLTSFYYGLRATIGSLMAFALMLELQQLWANHENSSGITRAMLLSALIQFGVTTAVALFFTDTVEATDRNSRELETNISKAKLEHERIKTLINSMADAVIATDPEGKITLYNAAALNILDTNQDLTGKDLRDVLSILNEERKPLDILTLSLQKNTNISADNLYLKYPDGELISVRTFVSQVRLGFGSNQEEGFILTLRDITREKSLEEEHDEFISVISHELRTPVTITEASISNAQYVVENSKDIDSIKKSLKTAHDEVLFLAGMLNDISTLSRAERGKLDLNPEEFDPKELLNALADDYRSEIEGKGLKLEVNTAEDTPCKVVSNHLYVREILQNLITNAQKYTKEGSITLNVSKASDGVTFSVKDTGIGISKTDQQKIFEKFFRSEDFRTRENSGTGLGLYITKKLAKIIDARFNIESQLNVGSTFSVTIPDLRDKLGAK
jgi:PAS domain S-box-containing protein